jgi:hypothetical protein
VARCHGASTIVELGSFKGKSTAYLASGAKAGNGAHVFAVDAWDTPGNVTGRFGYAEFCAPVRLERFDDRAPVVACHDGPGLRRRRGRHVGRPTGRAPVHRRRPRRGLGAQRLPLVGTAPPPGAGVVFDDYDTPKNPGVKRAVDALVADPAVPLDGVALHAERLAVCRWNG